jgi:Trm5-related predicted tRNA methylase
MLQAWNRRPLRGITTGVPDDIRAAFELVKDLRDMISPEPLSKGATVVQFVTFVNDVVKRTS